MDCEKSLKTYYGFIFVKKANGTICGRYPVTKKECILGRDTKCDIKIFLENVSGHHCSILFVDDKAYIRDKSVAGSTKVNGKRIGRNNFLLHHADEIDIGGRKFGWEYTKSYVEPNYLSGKKAYTKLSCSSNVPEHSSNQVNKPLVPKNDNKMTPVAASTKTLSKTLLSINKTPIIVAGANMSKSSFDTLKNSLQNQNSSVTSQSEHQIVKSLAMVPGRNIPLIGDPKVTQRKSWVVTHTPNNSSSSGAHVLNRLSSERLKRDSTPEFNSSYHYADENVEFDSPEPTNTMMYDEYSVHSNTADNDDDTLYMDVSSKPNINDLHMKKLVLSNSESGVSRRDTYSIVDVPIVVEQHTPVPRRSILKCSKTAKPNRSSCRMVQFARLPNTDGRIKVSKSRFHSGSNFIVSNDEANENNHSEIPKKDMLFDAEEFDDDLDGVQPLDSSVSSLINSPILNSSFMNKSSKRGSRGNKVMSLVNSIEKRTNESPKNSIRASDLLIMSKSKHDDISSETNTITSQSSISSRRINLEDVFEAEDSFKNVSCNTENEATVQETDRSLVNNSDNVDDEMSINVSEHVEKIAAVDKEISTIDDELTKVSGNINNVSTTVENEISTTDDKMPINVLKHVEKEIPTFDDEIPVNVSEHVEKIAAVEKETSTIDDEMPINVSEHVKKIAAVDKEISTIDDELTKVSGNINNVSTTVENEISTTNDKMPINVLKHVEKEIPTFDDEIPVNVSEHVEKIAAVEKETSTIDDEMPINVSEHVKKIAAVDKEISTVDDKITNVSGNINNVSTTVENEIPIFDDEMPFNVSEHVEKITAVEKEMSTIDDEMAINVSELVEKVASAEKEISTISNESSCLLNHVSGHAEEIDISTLGDEMSNAFENINEPIDVEKDSLNNLNNVSNLSQKSIEEKKDTSGLRNNPEHVVNLTSKKIIAPCMSSISNTSADKFGTTHFQHNENVENNIMLGKSLGIHELSCSKKNTFTKNINDDIMNAIEMQLDEIHSDKSTNSNYNEKETICDSSLSIVNNEKTLLSSFVLVQGETDNPPLEINENVTINSINSSSCIESSKEKDSTASNLIASVKDNSHDTEVFTSTVETENGTLKTNNTNNLSCSLITKSICHNNQSTNQSETMGLDNLFNNIDGNGSQNSIRKKTTTLNKSKLFSITKNSVQLDTSDLSTKDTPTSDLQNTKTCSDKTICLSTDSEDSEPKTYVDLEHTLDTSIGKPKYESTPWNGSKSSKSLQPNLYADDSENDDEQRKSRSTTPFNDPECWSQMMRDFNESVKKASISKQKFDINTFNKIKYNRQSIKCKTETNSFDCSVLKKTNAEESSTKVTTKSSNVVSKRYSGSGKKLQLPVVKKSSRISQTRLPIITISRDKADKAINKLKTKKTLQSLITTTDAESECNFNNDPFMNSSNVTSQSKITTKRKLGVNKLPTKDIISSSESENDKSPKKSSNVSSRSNIITEKKNVRGRTLLAENITSSSESENDKSPIKSSNVSTRSKIINLRGRTFQTKYISSSSESENYKSPIKSSNVSTRSKIINLRGRSSQTKYISSSSESENYKSPIKSSNVSTRSKIINLRGRTLLAENITSSSESENDKIPKKSSNVSSQSKITMEKKKLRGRTLLSENITSSSESENDKIPKKSSNVSIQSNIITEKKNLRGRTLLSENITSSSESENDKIPKKSSNVSIQSNIITEKKNLRGRTLLVENITSSSESENDKSPIKSSNVSSQSKILTEKENLRGRILLVESITLSSESENDKIPKKSSNVSSQSKIITEKKNLRGRTLLAENITSSSESENDKSPIKSSNVSSQSKIITEKENLRGRILLVESITLSSESENDKISKKSSNVSSQSKIITEKKNLGGRTLLAENITSSSESENDKIPKKSSNVSSQSKITMEKKKLRGRTLLAENITSSSESENDKISKKSSNVSSQSKIITEKKNLRGRTLLAENITSSSESENDKIPKKSSNVSSQSKITMEKKKLRGRTLLAENITSSSESENDKISKKSSNVSSQSKIITEKKNLRGRTLLAENITSSSESENDKIPKKSSNVSSQSKITMEKKKLRGRTLLAENITSSSESENDKISKKSSNVSSQSKIITEKKNLRGRTLLAENITSSSESENDKIPKKSSNVSSQSKITMEKKKLRGRTLLAENITSSSESENDKISKKSSNVSSQSKIITEKKNLRGRTSLAENITSSSESENDKIPKKSSNVSSQSKITMEKKKLRGRTLLAENITSSSEYENKKSRQIKSSDGSSTNKKKFVSQALPNDFITLSSESEYSSNNGKRSFKSPNASGSKKRSPILRPVRNLRTRIIKNESNKSIRNQTRSNPIIVIEKSFIDSNSEVCSLKSNIKSIVKDSSSVKSKKNSNIETNTSKIKVTEKSQKIKSWIKTRITRSNTTLTESSLPKLDKKNKTSSPVKIESSEVVKTKNSKSSKSNKSRLKRILPSEPIHKYTSECESSNDEDNTENPNSVNHPTTNKEKCSQSDNNFSSLSTKRNLRGRVCETLNVSTQLKTRSRKRNADVSPFSQPIAKSIKCENSSKVASTTTAHVTNSAPNLSSSDTKRTRQMPKLTATQDLDNSVKETSTGTRQKEKTRAKKRVLKSEDNSIDLAPSTRKMTRKVAVKVTENDIKKSTRATSKNSHIDEACNSAKVKFDMNVVIKSTTPNPIKPRSTKQAVSQKEDSNPAPRVLRSRK